jgi:hypothetical protein
MSNPKDLKELHLLLHKLEFDTYKEFIKLFESITPSLEEPSQINNRAEGIDEDDDYNNCPWLSLVDGLRSLPTVQRITKGIAGELISLWKKQRMLSSSDIQALFGDYFCIAMAMSIASLSRHNLQILTEQMLVKQAVEDSQKKWGSDA